MNHASVCALVVDLGLQSHYSNRSVGSVWPVLVGAEKREKSDQRTNSKHENLASSAGTSHVSSRLLACQTFSQFPGSFVVWVQTGFLELHGHLDKPQERQRLLR